MNKIKLEEFINSTKKLLDESIKIYNDHPDQNELLRFRNSIEETLTLWENMRKILDEVQ